MHDLAEIVIVTYETDVDQCVDLVASIRHYGFINKDIKIRVIVNDNESVYQRTVAKTKTITNITVHRQSEFNVDITKSGWSTQQYLKLVIAEHVETPWYVIIDSDQGLWGAPVELEDWFYTKGDKIRARYRPVTFAHYQQDHLKHFANYWINTAELLDITDEVGGKFLLADIPPVAINTALAKNLLSDYDVFSIIHNDVCHEFALYWGYLLKKNLVDDFYVPLESFSKSHNLRIGRPLPPLPYYDI